MLLWNALARWWWSWCWTLCDNFIPSLFLQNVCTCNNIAAAITALVIIINIDKFFCGWMDGWRGRKICGKLQVSTCTLVASSKQFTLSKQVKKSNFYLFFFSPLNANICAHRSILLHRETKNVICTYICTPFITQIPTLFWRCQCWQQVTQLFFIFVSTQSVSQSLYSHFFLFDGSGWRGGGRILGISELTVR